MEAVALHERPRPETCPFCKDALGPDDDAWPCERCGTRLHAECFEENGLACTVLGCTGRARKPTPDVPPDPVAEEAKRLARLERAAAREARRAAEEKRSHPADARSPGRRLPWQRGPRGPAYPWFQGPIGLVNIFLAPVLGLYFGLQVGGRLGLALGILGVALCFGTIILVAALGEDHESS